MTRRDDAVRVRPGRIRDKSFVGQVMRAAKKAGHSGKRFGGGKNRGRISTFGRGRRAAAALNLRSNSRRVVIRPVSSAIRERASGPPHSPTTFPT